MGVVSTLAGSGTAGYLDGTGIAADFDSPTALTVDGSGTVVLGDSHRIRMITPAGVVTTLAGSGTGTFADGTGVAASFHYPNGVVVDAASGNIYVADTYNHRIRMVTPAGVTTTIAGNGTAAFADGTGAAARFRYPTGIAQDAAGNLIVADMLNNSIRVVTQAGVVTTLAGGGTGLGGYVDATGSAARFDTPYSVALDASDNVYVADVANHRIRMVSPTGVVTTLAGSGTPGFADGTGAGADFQSPTGVAVDSTGNVYVADADNNRIRMVTPAGVTTTVAGDGTADFADGDAAAAFLNGPCGVAIDAGGTVYIADTVNNRIRLLTLGPPAPVLAPCGPIVKASQVQDDFAGGLADPRWFVGSGTLDAASGRVRVLSDSADPAFFYWRCLVDLTESSIFIKVAPDLDVNTRYRFSMTLNDDNYVSFVVVGPNPSALRFRMCKDRVVTDTFTDYDPLMHAWWRLSEVGGTVRWDVSDSGLAWVNQRNAVHGMDLSEVTIVFENGADVLTDGFGGGLFGIGNPGFGDR